MDAKTKDGVEGMPRREAVAALLRDRAGLLVVTGLGSPSYDVMAAGDHPRNFYLWGAMGAAAQVGLGLALARPEEKVAVITGDGEQLMGLGSFATIGARRPANLSVIVLDNRHYGETGMQSSHTGHGVDLAAVASACGFAWSMTAAAPGDLDAVRARIHAGEGPGFAAVRIRLAEETRVLPPRDGVEIKNRFRRQFGLETI